MTTSRSRLSLGNAFALAALVFLAAFCVRLVGAADAPMHFDEYYTILAAQSYAAEGIPRIWEGVYPRALGFTVIVAGALSAFGDTLLAARLPSVLAGSLVVALAFLWLRREAGAAAGWLIAILLALSASSIGIAQFSRFYTLHALLFLVCALAVYQVIALAARPALTPAGVTARPRAFTLLAWALIAVLSAAGALHLQDITGIGLLALAAWALPALMLQPAVRAQFTRARILPALLLTLLGVFALAVFTDVANSVAQAYAKYRWTALWGAGHRDNYAFYVQQIAHALPVLFYLFPVAVVVSLARAPRAASFCLVVCAVALLLHSFAGMKDMRYVHYLWPFLLAPWAIAGAALLAPLRRAVRTAWSTGTAALRAGSVPAGGRGSRAPWLRIASVCALGFALAVVLVGNREYRTLRKLPSSLAAELGIGEPARAARAQALARQQGLAALRKLVDAGGFLATTSELHALWYLGHFDLVVHASRLHDFAPGQEFARDPRTGGLVISEPSSLARVVNCQPSGILLVWENDWRRAHALNSAVADLVESTMHETALPAGLEVRAFQWKSGPASKPSCTPPLKLYRASPLAARPERAS